MNDGEFINYKNEFFLNWQRFELHMKIRHKELSPELIGSSTLFLRLSLLLI